jgi:hypothetical protein
VTSTSIRIHLRLPSSNIMQLTLRSLVPFALVACAWASPAATDAAKGDAHLFLCNEGGCSSGCERSNSLQQLTPNACYKRSHAFGFASAYIQSTASLPYTVSGPSKVVRRVH